MLVVYYVRVHKLLSKVESYNTREEVTVMPENNLRGRIIAKFHSVKNFSQAIKWSTRKTYAIVNGKQQPTCRDIETICNLLDIQIPQDFRDLFLM